MKLYWLSFATKEQFLGALALEVPDGFDPILYSHRLKLNPGGQVLFDEVPPEEYQHFPPSVRNRLLSKKEAQALCE